MVSAADRATYLLETYPQSRYQNDAVALLAAAYEGLGNEALAADARKRMGELRDMFARHELDTALYYLRRTAYVATASFW